jgi:hypothetical protein
MKTLGNLQDRQQILERINSLHPDNRARWGKMSCHQMVCHLTDCFRLTLGEKPAASVDTFLTRTVFRWVALEAPIPWPHGYKTRPEFNQTIGGTRPQVFERDLQELQTLFGRFMEARPELAWRHPSFGPMSQRDSMRWAYLHIDHHLRQFGA